MSLSPILKVKLKKDGELIDQTVPVHNSCWDALGDVPGYEASEKWWGSFASLLDSLASHLNRVPYLAADIWPEESLGDRDRYASFPVIQQRPNRPCVLPLDVIHMIYDCLDCYEDVMNFQEAILIPPLSALWLRLGRRFLSLETFRDGNQSDTSLKIQRAFWKIHNYPSRFRQAVNFGVVWHNAQQVLNRMSVQLHGMDTHLAPNGEYNQHRFWSERERAQKINRSSSLLEGKSDVYLRFSHVGDRPVLCGVSVGESTTGYVGDYVRHVGQGICGQRLISNQNAFESVQMKRREGWDTEWHGCAPTRSHLAVLNEIDWDPMTNGWLLLGLDVSDMR